VLNLTSKSASRLGRWSAADIARYLKSGLNQYAVAAVPMGEAVQDATQDLPLMTHRISAST